MSHYWYVYLLLCPGFCGEDFLLLLFVVFINFIYARPPSRCFLEYCLMRSLRTCFFVKITNITNFPSFMLMIDEIYWSILLKIIIPQVKCIFMEEIFIMLFFWKWQFILECFSEEHFPKKVIFLMLWKYFCKIQSFIRTTVCTW